MDSNRFEYVRIIRFLSILVSIQLRFGVGELQRKRYRYGSSASQFYWRTFSTNFSTTESDGTREQSENITDIMSFLFSSNKNYTQWTLNPRKKYFLPFWYPKIKSPKIQKHSREQNQRDSHENETITLRETTVFCIFFYIFNFG